jgi:hypothetical protein
MAQANYLLATNGAPASLVLPASITVTEIKTGKSDFKNKEISIQFSNDTRIKLIELQKPATIALFKNEMEKLVKQKHETVKLKLLEKTVNSLLIESTDIESQKKEYKIMSFAKIKGKEYMFDKRDTDSLETAKLLIQICESLKAN